MKYSTFLLIASLFLSCNAQDTTDAYVFYLHGRIIETHGIHAVSQQFGAYKFTNIVDSLKANYKEVFADVRTSNTNFYNYSQGISLKIDSLINKGIAPHKISVIGASKGGVMAMSIASLNTNPINYILLGANNEVIESQNTWNLHGHILGIYEQSDSLAGNHYTYWKERSTNAKSFKQIKLNTGLGHGFFYKPIDAWWQPTKQWINSKTFKKE